VALLDLDHVAANAVAVNVFLTGDLLAVRQHRLDLAQVHQDDPGVLALLDDARHELALTAGELAEVDLVLGVAELLQDDLLGRGRGDAAEVARGVVELPEHLPALVVELGRENGHVPGFPVELGARLGGGALTPEVCDQ
jgi:hypothetical protein